MEIKTNQRGFQYTKMGSPVFVNWSDVKSFYVEFYWYGGFDAILHGIGAHIINIETKDGTRHKISNKAKITHEANTTDTNFLKILKTETGLIEGQNVPKFRLSTLILILVFSVVAITLFFVVKKLDL